MGWTWLIVILVFGLIAGPLLSAMPSKSQRRISALRERARVLGLRVRLQSVSDTGQSLAIYSLYFDQNEAKSLKSEQPWRLVKGKLDHPIHLLGRWDWDGDSQRGDSSWQDALRQLLQSGEGSDLLERCQLIEFSPKAVQIGWREHGAELSAVDAVADLLGRLKDFSLDRSATLAWPKTPPGDPVPRAAAPSN